MSAGSSNTFVPPGTPPSDGAAEVAAAINNDDGSEHAHTDHTGDGNNEKEGDDAGLSTTSSIVVQSVPTKGKKKGKGSVGAVSGSVHGAAGSVKDDHAPGAKRSAKKHAAQQQDVGGGTSPSAADSQGSA